MDAVMNRVGLLLVWTFFGTLADAQIRRTPASQSFLAINLTDSRIDRSLQDYSEPGKVARLNFALPNLSTDGWNKLSKFTALTRIDISRSMDLTDQQLAFAYQSPNLRMLTLSRCDKITGSFLIKSNQWRSLSSIVIKSKSFGGEKLVHLKDRSVQTLKLSSPMIRTRHLTALGEQKSLRELAISDSPKLFALDLTQFPNLTKLTIDSCGLRRLRGVSEHKNLAFVFLLDCENLRAIDFAGVKSLRTIEITNAAVGDRTVAGLSQLSNLTDLTLSGCGGVTKLDLKKLPNLSRLDLAATKLTTDGLTSIAKATKLRRVDLSRLEKLSDDVIRSITRLPGIKTVDVSDTDFSSDAYKQLEDLRNRPTTRVYMEPR